MTADLPPLEELGMDPGDLLPDGGVKAEVSLGSGDSLDDENDLSAGDRGVNVTIEGDDVNIELESQSPDRDDEVKVQYGADVARLKVSFETLGPLREEVEMRIEFRDLVEFEDTDGDGAFSLLEDEILRWLRVETLGIVRPPENSTVSTDSIIGQQINVNYGFPGSATGTFELIFRVFGLPTQVDGLFLGPTETKIDIRFTDFPFASDTSQLALGLDVKTNFELEMDPSLLFDQINATGEDFAAFFRWMPDAVLVDEIASAAKVTVIREAKEVDLLADVGELESELRLFLAYPRGAVIVHDPIVGIAAVDLIPEILVPGPSLATYAIGLATAIFLVLGMWALYRRRRS